MPDPASASAARILKRARLIHSIRFLYRRTWRHTRRSSGSWRRSRRPAPPPAWLRCRSRSRRSRRRRNRGQSPSRNRARDSRRRRRLMHSCRQAGRRLRPTTAAHQQQQRLVGWQLRSSSRHPACRRRASSHSRPRCHRHRQQRCRCQIALPLRSTALTCACCGTAAKILRHCC